MMAYSTLGFSVFDIVHIIFGLFFFVRAFIDTGENFEFDIAESSTEIVCSVLLLMFILVIAKENINPKERHHYFTFAWLIASVSTFLPEIFKMARIVANGSSTQALVLSCIQIAVSILAFVLFVAALFVKKEARAWITIMILGIIFFFLLVPFSLASTILEDDSSDVLRLLATYMIDVSPIFPSGFALYSVIASEVFLKNHPGVPLE